MTRDRSLCWRRWARRAALTVAALWVAAVLVSAPSMWWAAAGLAPAAAGAWCLLPPRRADGVHLPARWRLWAALRSPRAWRGLGAVLLVASAVTAAYQAGPGACRARSAGRQDVRRAIVAGVDEVAGYAALPEPDRALVVTRVEGRVQAELPPPDCWAWPGL